MRRFFHCILQAANAPTDVGFPNLRIEQESSEPILFQEKLWLFAVTFTGKFHIEILKKNERINSSRYIQFIKSVIQKFSRHVEPLTWENSILIQDNARHHTAKATQDFYAEKSLSTLKQPPYSPGL